METVKLARMAMATRFEVVLSGEDPVRLRAVGEEALREIGRLESQLSFYSHTSDLSRLNRTAHGRPAPVDGRLFELFVRAKQLWQRSAGAFDPTVGPLMRCWGLTGEEGRVPASDELQEARSRTGMHLVQLDSDKRTVRYHSPGVEIDFGGIGKGFAVDEAMRILRESGVASALLHGGTSTVSTIGVAAGGKPWNVVVGSPVAARLHAADGSDEEEAPEGRSSEFQKKSGVQDGNSFIGMVALRDHSLSVSDVGSKYFELDGDVHGHVIDPRTGMPSKGVSLAAVALPSAADADALSTALLVAGAAEREQLRREFPDARMLIADHRGTVMVSDFEPVGEKKQAARMSTEV